MAKFKDFGSPTAQEQQEDIQFQLYGEIFSCRRGIPGKIMLDFAARSGDNADPAAAARVIDDFFKVVLAGEDEYTRFNDLCADPEKLIPVEDIMAIVEWLMETYGERPTQRSEISASGQ